MTDKIEPALTPEEWADNPDAITCEWRIGDYRYIVAAEVMEDGTRGVSLCYPRGVDGPDMASIVGTWIPPEKVAAVAALCLHGQPFGFTREHVDVLREVLEGDLWDFTREQKASLERCAALIEALLPPEGK